MVHSSLLRLQGFLAAVLLACTACSENRTEVVVEIVAGAGASPTPARLEVLDSEGHSYWASNAIPVTNECVVAPFPEWLAPLQTKPYLYNPYRGTRQFYADGRAELALPPGEYRLRVEKGLEWFPHERTFTVAPGEATELRVELERFADPTQANWYGADDHLHITRMESGDDRRIARWMQAEGLHVANLLEMGAQAHFDVTPQHDYGDAGAYRDGTLLLLTGAEYLRTHLLGHAVSLGARERVRMDADYILYEKTFEAVEAQGGVNGFAHLGVGGEQVGLALHAPSGQVRFLEVLQFELAFYQVWYELLNLGFRIAPTAGTDFPCGRPSLPGRERFYVKVPGPVDRTSFVEAVVAGRTFVTNGPLLDFEVDGVGPGDQLTLAAPRTVRVVARVRFDPDRDRVEQLELVMNGDVVASADVASSPGTIELESELTIDRPAWLALRSRGDKHADQGPLSVPLRELGAQDIAAYLGAWVIEEGLRQFRETMERPRPSAAHTAPVYIELGERTQPPVTEAQIQRWLDRLKGLERDLADDRIDEITSGAWIPYMPQADAAHLRRHRAALREAIERARSYYLHHAESARE